MQKCLVGIALLFLTLTFSMSSYAGFSDAVEQEVKKAYPSAEKIDDFKYGYQDFNPDLVRSYVVIKKGGIPAERAVRYIGWGEYDYRGVTINFDKNQTLSTRRGKVYTYLKTGDVLAVVETKFFGRTIYLKLITPDIYIPEKRQSEKRFSRVTVMLGFKIPKDLYASSNDFQKILELMEEWIVPFRDLNAAKAYGKDLSGEAKLEDVEEKATKNADKQVKTAQDKKFDALEQKIEAAKKQMEEAEKELKEMKGKKK